MKLRSVLAAISAFVLLSAASLEAQADKLEDIIANGVVRIGVPMDNPPFGYQDANSVPKGIDIEMAELVAKALGVKLEMQQVTGANRVTYLLTDKVDIVISNLGLTPERAKQIHFTSPYMNSILGVFGPKDLPVSSAAELGNYRVASLKGGSAQTLISSLNPKANLMLFDSDSISATSYITGQTDLYASTNTVVVELAKNNPGTEFALKFILRNSPSHMAIRKDEPNLAHWLDSFIYYSLVVGDIEAIAERHLDSGMVPLALPLPSL